MISTGLVTFHSEPNFGALLQAWSLVQTLRKLGCDVTVIDYRPVVLDPRNRRRGWRAWVPSGGAWRMRRFMRQNLPLGPRTLRSREEVDQHVREVGYDCLICGSDQIWMKNPSNRLDRTYFLDVGGNDELRRISYAPSCGSMESYGEDSAEARRLIARFDAVSVRDERSLRILRDLGLENVTRVVDPTLLADFDGLITRPRPRADFIAVVGTTDSAAAALIRQLSERMSLPVVAIGTRCDAADEEHRFVHAGEWAGYLAEARFVVTSLFHGALMSMRFRKPMLALDCAGRAFKLGEVLARFGLGDRLLHRDEKGAYRLPEFATDLDYSEVEARIDEAATASIAYLRAALHG